MRRNFQIGDTFISIAWGDGGVWEDRMLWDMQLRPGWWWVDIGKLSIDIRFGWS